MIEKSFNIPFISKLALHEKQIQQNYRPVIGVHKWFARRPGTLFRGLLLSEFGNGPLENIFYKSHKLTGITVADPFMGGGTPILEANRLGCDVVGLDINPMAYWIVQREIAVLDLEEYKTASASLLEYLRNRIGSFYETTCLDIFSVHGFPVGLMTLKPSSSVLTRLKLTIRAVEKFKYPLMENGLEREMLKLDYCTVEIRMTWK